MSATQNESVLIVEDDEGVAILERRALERRGFRVSVAGSLPQALAVLTANTFDLVVTDYRLQNGTGLELLAQVHALGWDIPVILVTGFSDEATVIEAIRCGARDFVPKSAEYLRYLPDAVDRVLKAVRTERELAKSEARFQLFMDNSPAAAFIKDEAGRLLYANRVTQQTVGRRDWKGKTDFELWPHDTAAKLREHDMDVLCNNQATEVQESITSAGGETRHFLSYKFPMQDASGQRFIGGMAIDITQQLVAEEALRQRDEQLQQAQKMEAIGTLAGGVAHEFNNLLQAVLGYTRFAKSSIGEDHEAQGDLQVVVSAAERAALLTQQLLSFSRREPEQLAPLDVNVVIHELVTMLRPLIGEQVAIELALDDNIGTIAADHVQIQQLLMNLCINARDAMPQGGSITISTRALMIDEVDTIRPAPRPGLYLVLSVSDTGCGMTPDVKQKIFEPFFTTKPVGKGTGLGLAMVYSAVQHHAGAIKVDSELGVGTRFTIYLPMNPSGFGAKESTALVETRRGSGTILVAEDEPLVLDLAKRMLEGAGYEVLTATDGREAIRVFNDHRDEIDLVIFDVVMPQLSGWDAIHQIRGLNPTVPAIFATGYDREILPAFSNGAAPRVLRKPFGVDQLLELVQEVLLEACPCPKT